MAITHSTIKAAGQRLFAILDWNANHLTPSINLTAPAGNSLIVDNNLLIANATTKRVGVGTTTPTERFEIRTAGAHTYLSMNSETGYDAGFFFKENNVKKYLFQYDRSAGAFTVYDYESGTYTFIINDGKVGIYNMNPEELLEVGSDTVEAGNRKAIKLGEGGWGAPATPGANSSGDKLLLYKAATVILGLGMGGSNEMWFQTHGGAHAGFSFFTGAVGGAATEKFTILNDGRVGIGATTPAVSAKLEIASTTGALLLPRMTTVQRDALTAVNGMLIYNSTLNKFQGYENGVWVSLI